MHQLHLPAASLVDLVRISRTSSTGDGILPAGALASLPGLPAHVQAFLAGLAADHRVRLHQRGQATAAGATYYIDPSCRPDEVDPDHFAADDPAACYVVKAGQLKEAVATDYAGDTLVRVQYADGGTEMVYVAQTHESRLTAAWDVQDWRAKQAGSQEVAANG